MPNGRRQGVVSLLNRMSSHFFRREKLYALTLSIVLGIFGADWFYLCVTRSTFNIDIFD